MTATHNAVQRFVSLIMGTVIALTFLFGFGNVLGLGIRLGVPSYVAPLMAPAVDLSVLGLLLRTNTSHCTAPHTSNCAPRNDC